MKKVKLGSVCKKASSSIAQKDLEGHNGEYPVYGASGYIKNIDFFQQDKPYIAVVKDGAGIGRIMRLPGKSSVIGTMQYIIPNEDMNIAYLAYAMEYMNLAKYYSGSTIPHIYFNSYQNEELNYRSLEEQEKIASVLEKITGLISKHQQQLTILDQLVKSNFIEMFGNPIINSENFPVIKGENFFKLSNGKFVPADRRQETGIPAYGGNGISWFTNQALCETDTLVVGRVGFQSGNVHFATGPLWITDNAMYVSQFDDSVFCLKFLYFLMDYIDFSRFQDAGDLKKVTQQPFMEMEYICPPIQIQKEYLRFVQQADQSKRTIQQSLDTLTTLKKSLMQTYFG